jgi:hypothetical protein
VFLSVKERKKIGYEMGYYMRREEKEFFNYIYDKTGIEFQK